MSSQIDATVPADNVKADKSLFRLNFQIAKNEITDLQNQVSIPMKMALDDTQFDAV